MAENFSFFDPVEVAPGVWDREYFAQQFTDYFRRLVTTGVMKGESGELKVSTEGNSMITTLNTGVAYVVGRSYENTSPLSHTHDTEVLGKNRIDRIVVRLDLRTESRFVKSFIKKGVASTIPVPPNLQRDQFIYEISLAQVKIIGGQTYININDVVDERGKTDICPWAGSKILPNFDNATLEEHIHDYKEHIPYVVTGGTGESYVIKLDGVTDYYEGLAVAIKIHAANTDDAPIIKIEGLAAKAILKQNGQRPKTGSLRKDAVYTLRYNGKDFILQGEGGSGTAQPADVLTGKTFTNDNGEQTGSMVNRGAQIITPKSSLQYIPQGYHNGAGYVAAVPPVSNLEYRAVRATDYLYKSDGPRKWFHVTFTMQQKILAFVVQFNGFELTYNGTKMDVDMMRLHLVNDTGWLASDAMMQGVNDGAIWQGISARADTLYGNGIKAVGNTIYVDVLIEATSGLYFNYTYNSAIVVQSLYI
ncbi:hypothetical protein [Heyndrickxia oleronia]|uniref:Uncharacterized protein n=1 Tax=Heyndrickxia oleronia TaxID=38875 RepID=A0AAW6SRR2_9BACI|nr:hypothetical protein [Heyndrickxia oleronia]MDH5161516.1 hypothetical protein [Heyndrickxia oleronia]